MSLIKLTDQHFVDPEQVSSLEDYEHWRDDASPSGGNSTLEHTGTIAVLKCGRKIYIKGIKAADLFIALKQGEL